MDIQIKGDEAAAAHWLSFAKSRLRALQTLRENTGVGIVSQNFPMPTADIHVSSSDDRELIRIVGKGGEFIIVCYVGDTTGDFSSKRFYDIKGNEIARDEPGAPGMPAGWTLKDDGLYGLMSNPPDPLDPWNNMYAYNPGGLGIPACGSGISAKSQAGKTGRYILNDAVEDETFEAFTWRVLYPAVYDYTYEFVRQVDSLTYAPYSIYGPKPFFSRYAGDRVLAMIVPWSGYDATYTWDAYASDNFRDKLPKMNRIWKIAIKDGVRNYTDVSDYGDAEHAVIGATGGKVDGIHRVRILRAKTQTWAGSLMSEPIRDEVYDLTAGTMIPGTIWHRCDDPANELCYFYDAYTDSGYPNTASTIGDDVRVPHAIDAEGRQSYVRIQKTGDFDSIKTGIYCGDALVEETGWEAVIKSNPTDRRGPVLIRKTRYRIIHVHSDADFKAIVYSKTQYVSHSDELLPYKITMEGNFRQIRKTMIRSVTTYHIAVNGIITDLGYSNYRREYRLTAEQGVYAGPPIATVHAHMVDLPWADCGYDAAGVSLGEDNSVVMRCDTNSAMGLLFVGFDVYPVEYRHDLVYDAHQNLTLDYREDIKAFPPSSDALYPTVKGRRWMLFGQNGTSREITPPQKTAAEGAGHVNRINGLAFMGA